MNPKITRELLERVGLNTRREFKERKRAELALVLKALDRYQLGSAYCPEFHTFKQVRDAVRKIKAAQSVASWGR